MSKKCSKILSLNLDLFSLPISLFFKGKRKRFTYFGTILSVFMYSFLIVAFFESDFYNKVNPIIVKQDKLLSHANRISFDENTVITISVVDNQGNSIADPSMYDFQFMVIHEKVNYTTGLFQYVSLDSRKLHLCTVNDTNNNTDLWNEISPINSYCLDDKRFSVEGGWNENDVQFVYIVLNMCNNATSPVTCAPREKILQFFDKSPRFMCVQHHSAEVDFYDYYDPIKINYAFSIPQINSASTKKNFLYLKQVNLQSDNGWLFSDVIEYKSFTYDRMDTDWLPRVDDRIFITQIYASQNYEMDTRRYQKLPEVIASLIGMSKLYVIFFGFFVNFVNEFQTMKTILRKLKINKIGKPTEKVKLSRFTNEIRKSEAMLLTKKSTFIKHSQNESFKEQVKISKKVAIKTEKIQKTNNRNRANNEECSKIQLSSKFHKVEQEKENANVDDFSGTARHISLSSVPLEIERKNVPYATFVKSSFDNNLKTTSHKNVNFSIVPIESEIQESHILQKNVIKNEIKELNQGLSLKLSEIPIDISPVKIKSKRRSVKNPRNEKPYDFSMYDYFMSRFMIIFKKTDQQKRIAKLKKAYSKKLDLIKILTDLKELKTLKKILLDKDQLVIFNFINKPSIESHEKDDKRKIHKKQRQKEKFIVSYNKLLERMNDVDERLFLLADENIDKGE